MIKVFVTLISFNNNQTTWECLESLENLQKNDFDLNVAVVDNASEVKFSVNKQYQNFKLKVIRSEQNTGFSGGQNLAIKYALNQEADFVVILNNDTIVDPNLINELLGAFKNDIGIVAPKIYFAKGYEFHKDRYQADQKGKVIWYAGGIIDWGNVTGKHRGVDEVDKGQFEKICETDFATGCCMMIKKDVFAKVGFLDDKFFLYYEDSDFSFRVKKKGFKIMYQPRAMLWHKNAQSAGGSGSQIQDYYITRNRMLFGFKYASIRIKLALARESLTIMLRGRRWQKIGIKDFYLRRFGKGSY